MVKFVALLLLEVTTIIVAQWTTMTSIPYFDYGGAVSFGDTVFAAVGITAHIVDTTTGVWTTVSSRPISSYGATASALRGQRAIMSGGIPGIATVHIFNLQTVAWTTKASLPVGRTGCASGCDGQHFWVAAGWEPGYRSFLHEYDSDADIWTSKASLPFATSGVSGVYYNGDFFVSRDDWILKYSVALDSWTTGMSLPSFRERLYGGVTTFAGFGFVVGAFIATPSNDRKLERYDIDNDAWTLLDPVPLPSSGTITAITSSGLLVAIGHDPVLTYVHGFTTGLTAAVHGDPVFTAFDGSVHHLSLRSGVFNFLSTPTVVVNALVEYFPQLPPEESTFVTMVGVVALYRGCVIQVTFVASAERHQSSNLYVLFCEEEEVSDLVVADDHIQKLCLHDISLEVVFNCVHYAHPLVDVAFLDLRVRSHTPLLAKSGLLSDLSARNLSSVQQKLDAANYYDVLDGCLFSTDTHSATHSFHHLELAGLGC